MRGRIQEVCCTATRLEILTFYMLKLKEQLKDLSPSRGGAAEFDREVRRLK